MSLPGKCFETLIERLIATSGKRVGHLTLKPMIFSHFIRYTCKARPVQFISRKNLSEHAVTATSISNPNLHNFHDVLLEKVRQSFAGGHSFL